ncbi:MAG: hypothetical protein QNL62_23195 [Gammaproteobacteria bacterium]|nr:hypothetical protein [Gammaproteobacteria bacterium]
MKTLKTLFASALAAGVAFTGTAQAEQLWDDALYNIIHPESADIFNVGDYKKSTAASIRSYGDDYNKDSVWSYEFEEYVNPADYHQAEMADAGDVNKYMGSHPTAAGKDSRQVFFYNELAGEYHLQ